jgi:hypothetical protein
LRANEPHAKGGTSASQVDTETTASIEKLVSREEQPVRIERPKPTLGVISMIPDSAPPVAGQAKPTNGLPRPYATAADRRSPAEASAAQGPAQSGATDLAAASRVHLANSTDENTPPVLGGGYAVQVASERSENEAQAAFRMLQAKYPKRLGDRAVIIRRADLGAAGTYYRALVGPLRSADEAKRLCSGLKAAGADCIRVHETLPSGKHEANFCATRSL